MDNYLTSIFPFFSVVKLKFKYAWSGLRMKMQTNGIYVLNLVDFFFPHMEW